MAIHVDSPADQREFLQRSAQHDEQEFREAVQDLKEAVSRPFRVAHRFTSNPLPWVIGAALVGFYFGIARGNESE